MNKQEKEGYFKWLESDKEDTFTVGELIDFLKKYPPGMKVMVTWESILREIKKECIYESWGGSLYIDADDCSCKEEFAKDPNENED